MKTCDFHTLLLNYVIPLLLSPWLLGWSFEYDFSSLWLMNIRYKFTLPMVCATSSVTYSYLMSYFTLITLNNIKDFHLLYCPTASALNVLYAPGCSKTLKDQLSLSSMSSFLRPNVFLPENYRLISKVAFATKILKLLPLYGEFYFLFSMKTPLIKKKRVAL